MKMNVTHLTLLGSALALMVAVGCADTQEPVDETLPLVQGLNKTSYAVGEVFEMQGRNFVPGHEGRNFVRFVGKFVPARGGFAQDVDMEVPVFLVDEDDAGNQVVQWTRFGPFTHPFAIDGKVGRFDGELQAIVERKDGSATIGARKPTNFEVEPSIEFVEVQPIGADCGMPALSGFGGLPYRITVRAMGFTPRDFEFRITGLATGPTMDAPVFFNKAATGPSVSIGEDEDVVFQPVPADSKFYVAGIYVKATDAASGGEVEALLPFNIHRPMEIDYNGNFQVAEYYEPEPVTACIPGSIGNRVSYSETHDESVQRSVSINLSRDWGQEHSVSNSQDWNEGYGVSDTEATSVTVGTSQDRTEGSSLSRGTSYNESESNDFSYGTSDAENWNTSHNIGGSVSVEVGAEGGASIPLVAEGKVRTSVGVTGNYSYTTGQGGSTSNSRNWGSTNSRGSSSSMSDSYTLSNSTSNSRSISDSTSRSSSRTYSFGGSATASERISEGMSEAEGNTWSSSSSNSTLTGFTGFIPVGQFGVFYRQTVRLVRVAQLYSYNACGERELMGEMLLNEWKWAPSLAIGDECETKFPTPDLPPAQCIIPPCN